MESRGASAQARLVEIPPAPETDDHQAAARAYADAMQTLAKLLNKGDAESARDELRRLIDSVTLFPAEPYQPYNIEVRGPVVALSLVAGAGFRRQDYADTEIKEIFGPRQTAGACAKPRFIGVAWDIGPTAAAA